MKALLVFHSSSRSKYKVIFFQSTYRTCLNTLNRRETLRDRFSNQNVLIRQTRERREIKILIKKSRFEPKNPHSVFTCTWTKSSDLLEKASILATTFLDKLSTSSSLSVFSQWHYLFTRRRTSLASKSPKRIHLAW